MKINKKILAQAIMGAMLGLSLVLTPVFLGAQNSGTNVQPSDSNSSINSDVNCQVALKPIIAKEEKDFREFTENTFRNRSDASALIDTGIQRFAQMRKRLLGEIDKYQAQAGKNLALSAQQILTCQKMVDDSLITAEGLLKKHVLTNAQSKKTTKLVQKMKEINTKLGEMQREIGYMQGYMAAFSQKLPCFTKQCL